MSDNDYEWLTLAEIIDKIPSAADVIATYPIQLNVIPLYRMKRYSDGTTNLNIRFEGLPEHVEHVGALFCNQHTTAEIDNDGIVRLTDVRLEQVGESITQVMAEAITGFPLPLEKGYSLRHTTTKQVGEFQEWALGDELQIVVRVDGEKRPLIWNIEDVLTMTIPPKLNQTIRGLVRACIEYPQYASDWNKRIINRAQVRGLVDCVEECADGVCVDVLHITKQGKRWYTS